MGCGDVGEIAVAEKSPLSTHMLRKYFEIEVIATSGSLSVQERVAADLTCFKQKQAQAGSKPPLIVFPLWSSVSLS